jgi:hypothetical protein
VGGSDCHALMIIPQTTCQVPQIYLYNVGGSPKDCRQALWAFSSRISKGSRIVQNTSSSSFFGPQPSALVRAVEQYLLHCNSSRGLERVLPLMCDPSLLRTFEYARPEGRGMTATGIDDVPTANVTLGGIRRPLGVWNFDPTPAHRVLPQGSKEKELVASPSAQNLPA